MSTFLGFFVFILQYGFYEAAPVLAALLGAGTALYCVIYVFVRVAFHYWTDFLFSPINSETSLARAYRTEIKNVAFNAVLSIFGVISGVFFLYTALYAYRESELLGMVVMMLLAILFHVLGIYFGVQFTKAIERSFGAVWRERIAYREWMQNQGE